MLWYSQSIRSKAGDMCIDIVNIDIILIVLLYNKYKIIFIQNYVNDIYTVFTTKLYKITIFLL